MDEVVLKTFKIVSDGDYFFKIIEVTLGDVPVFEDKVYASEVDALEDLMEYRRNQHYYMCDITVSFIDDSGLDELLPF